MGDVLTPVTPGAAGRPNVMLIISDQQRADTMPGVRTAPGIRTPHLEWLAERGILFRRAYCASPVCSPARAALLSGLLPHTTGMVANNQPRPVADEIHLSPDVRVLADYLKPEGYACGYFGKWHLGTGGDRRGFDAAVARSGNHEVDTPAQNVVQQFCARLGIELSQARDPKAKGLDEDPGDYDARTTVGASLLPLAFHPSMLHAQAAARFILAMGHASRPFAAVYSCHEPHAPFLCPRPFDRMYEPADMPLAPTLREVAGRERMAARGEDKLGAPRSLSDDDYRAITAAYYGAVSYVDHLVGIILAALIESGQLDNTLIIFTSDHGEFLGAHGMLGKGASMYDDLVNVPLLIKPPRRPGGADGGGGARQSDALVSHVDVVPTILRWCGAAVPSGLHGTDIRSLMEGAAVPVRQGVAFEYHSANWGDRPIPLRGWRTEDWKYVETLDGTDELYDVRSDPNETRNLIDDAVAAPAREAMRAALHRWLDESGDTWPAVPAVLDSRGVAVTTK